MKIGIMGAGAVGSSFGRALTKAGHEVMFSSRNPSSAEMETLVSECSNLASAGTIQETLAFSDVIAIAMQWSAIPDMIKNAGNWSGKTVIDMNNFFGALPSGSVAKEIAHLTGAKVVKALNTIGAEHYQHPVLGGQQASMLIAGNDTTAKQTVSNLIRDIGFEVVDAGNLEAATYLESLAALWVHLAFTAGQGRNIAFKLIRG